MRVCSVPVCPLPAEESGMCRVHYNRLCRRGKNWDRPVVGRGWHGNSEAHAAAGRRGGAKVSGDPAHMAEIGKLGGASLAQDREHMAEIGRRGGRSRGESKA